MTSSHARLATPEVAALCQALCREDVKWHQYNKFWNATLIGQIIYVLVIQDGVINGHQRIIIFTIEFNSIFFSPFELVLWSASPLRQLSHFVEKSITLLISTALKYLCKNHGDQRVFFRIEIIINILVSSFRFLWIPIYVMGLRPLKIFLLWQCGDWF